MTRQPFYETESEPRWWLGIGGRVALVVALIVALSAGGWALKVGLSGVKGRGDAHIQQQSATNRIAQNSQFFALKAAYDKDVAALPIYRDAAKSGDTAAVIQYRGMVAHCIGVVADYTAASGAYISKDFRDAGLPPALDDAACK